MPRHSSHYRLGAPEDALAPIDTRGGGLLTPSNANMLLGAGLLLGLGVVGYYVWKGGSLTELWSRLTAGAAPRETRTMQLRPGVTVEVPVFKAGEPAPVWKYIPPELTASQRAAGAAQTGKSGVGVRDEF